MKNPAQPINKLKKKCFFKVVRVKPEKLTLLSRKVLPINGLFGPLGKAQKFKPRAL